MADGDNTPIAASGTGSPAPVAQEPAPAATPPAATPAPVESASAAPPAEAAPASAEPPASDAGAIPPAEPTLLEKFDAEQKAKDAATEKKPETEAKPEGEKPATEAAAKPEGEKPTDPAAEAPKPELPAVEYKYELPETLKMDDARRGEFHTALDAFRGDNANPQPLIDLHNKAISEYAQHMSREQHRVFAETRQNWQREVMSDPQLGGAGHQTAMGAVARMRDMLVAEKDRPAFEEFLRITGAGDHPQFLKLLHNAARHFDEPPLPPANPQPPKDIGTNGRGRRGVLYDNPRSQTARQ